MFSVKVQLTSRCKSPPDRVEVMVLRRKLHAKASAARNGMAIRFLAFQWRNISRQFFSRPAGWSCGTLRKNGQSAYNEQARGGPHLHTSLAFAAIERSSRGLDVPRCSMYGISIYIYPPKLAQNPNPPKQICIEISRCEMVLAGGISITSDAKVMALQRRSPFRLEGLSGLPGSHQI